MSLKNIVFPKLARLGQALSSPMRLEIVDWLCQREFSVEDLAITIDASIAITSHHLQLLKAANLVVARTEGQRRIYSLRGGTIPLWQALVMAGNENLSEVRDALSGLMADAADFTEATPHQLKRWMKSGAVQLIDVRPEEEFASAHFPGAISIPMAELETKLRTLPKKREVIAYCRGPYCVMSHDAVLFLRKHGYRARRWPAGVADWVSAGIRLEHGLPGQSRRVASSLIRRKPKTVS